MYGPVKVFTGTLASAASTVAIDVSQAWQKVFVAVPSFSTNAAVDCFGSADGTTYYQFKEQVNTAPVQFQSFIIASSSNNALLSVPYHVRYYQFRTTGVVDNGATFTLICSE